jgi:hypothetical protein
VNLLVGVAAAASPPATNPADPLQQRVARDWLDRAESDIAALPADTPADFILAQPHELAIALYRTAPTDDRRGLALRLIDRVAEVEAGKKKSAEQVRAAYVDAAMLHAQLDDLDGARRCLAAADKPSGALPSTDPIMPLADGFTQAFRAETMLLLGDRAAFERADLTPLGYAIIDRDLRGSGHPDEAKMVEDWAARKSKAQAQTQPAGFDDPGQDRVEAAKALATTGKWADAFKAAAAADVDLPVRKDEVVLRGYNTFNAFVAVGREARDAGSIDQYRLARTAAIDVLKKYPDGFFNIMDLLDLCARARDKDGFSDAEAQFRLHNGKPSDVRSLAQFGTLCARMGDIAGYLTAVDEAEQVLSKPDRDESATAEQRAIGFLYVAGARARAGDIAGVARDVDASKRTAKLDGGYLDDGWENVCDGYADAGLFDQAVAAMADMKDDRYGGIPIYIALRQAEAGRFDDAWLMALRVPMRRRIELEYQLAVRQVQAGQLANVSARVDAAKSAHERAVLDLAIAQALLGRPYQGNFRRLRPFD